MYIPSKDFFPEHRRSVNTLKDELEQVRNQVERIKGDKPEFEKNLKRKN